MDDPRVSDAEVTEVTSALFISCHHRKGVNLSMDKSDELDELVERLIGGLLDELAGLPLRDTTKRMICNMYLDLPLSTAQKDDFGVYTPDHYRALKAVLEPADGVTMRELAAELDSCLGKGAALNTLVRKYAPQYQDVRFETMWDTLKLT